MEQLAWILWIVLGVALIIAEIFTFGFVLFCFGVGALAAALVGGLGFGYGLQFLAFAVISIVLTVMSRTIFARYFLPDDENSLKMGMDALPGQIGTVSITARRGRLFPLIVGHRCLKAKKSKSCACKVLQFTCRKSKILKRFPSGERKSKTKGEN
jgi:membrane protein implicated in regulation of membrane protease activity